MAVTRNRFLRFFAIQSRRFDLSRKFAWLITAAAIISGIVTYATLTSKPPFGPKPETVTILLTINVAILLLLGAFVLRGLLALWGARKKNRAGSKLHVRLVMLLGMLAVVPTIIVASFSAIFFNLGVEAWFSERVNTALNESRSVAEAYLREHQEVLRSDIQAMANDIDREKDDLINDSRNT
jgi:two-component system nitrogen regulation sensor histidine kinase NtrY